MKTHNGAHSKKTIVWKWHLQNKVQSRHTAWKSECSSTFFVTLHFLVLFRRTSLVLMLRRIRKVRIKEKHWGHWKLNGNVLVYWIKFVEAFCQGSKNYYCEEDIFQNLFRSFICTQIFFKKLHRFQQTGSRITGQHFVHSFQK